MSDIVWSIDARNDNLNDLLDRMRDFAFNALSEKEIGVEFIQQGLDKNTRTNVKIRQNLFSIFKEAINNIVKHSGADRVRIELLNTDSGFSMKISDNGKGFDQELVVRGNGLKNMRMRAERISAHIEIEVNNGTSIHLRRKAI
jgi:signal transduction histidine kinase